MRPLISQRHSSVWRLRWFVLLSIGLLVGLVTNGLFYSPTTQAADATWDNQALVYKNDVYTHNTNPSLLSSLGLNAAGKVYVFQPTSASQLKILHFPPGSDIATSASAEHIVYDYQPPDTYTETSTITVSVEPAGEHSEVFTTECGIESIGWIVCPVTTFLARGMDWMYDKLDGFLKSQPLNVTDTQSGMYQTWRVMLGFANAAFIIMFLLIAYSHITSIGISNYSIKKLLPRLIIAAILVNLSYYICALAIDLSNITGHSFQDLFIQIRNTSMTTGQASNTGAVWSWESIATLILSGGAAGAAATAGVTAALVATGGSLTASIILLLPVLVGAALTLLAVLLVLAARQALIVILTIIAPLAFVCYLLPGTEKWFEKWRNTFLTMLLFFPAFSAVFGGSQLAATAILQNASSIIMVILGLAVQIAPLALAPLILRLSGGLLNRFAGVINNPNRGLVDRTRNWASQQAQLIANRRSLGNEGLKKRHFLRRAGRYLNHSQRLRKDRLEDSEKQADNLYHESGRYQRQDLLSRRTNDHSQLIEQLAANRYDEAKTGHAQPLKGRSLRDKLTRRFSANYAAKRDLQADREADEFAQSVRELHQNLAIQGLRKNTAERVLNSQIADDLQASPDLQRQAAGIYGQLGEDSALASSISTSRSLYGKSVDEAREILKSFNVSSEDRQILATGGSIRLPNGRKLDSNNLYAKEAAIEEQLRVGTVGQVAEVIASSSVEFKGTISSALASSGVKSKAPFLGGRLINEITKGSITDMAALEKYIAGWVQGGKFSPTDLSHTDKEGLELLIQSVDKNIHTIDANHLNALGDKVEQVLENPELRANVSDAAEPYLKLLQNALK